MNPVIKWCVRCFDEQKSVWHWDWFDNDIFLKEHLKNLLKIGYKKENILLYELKEW